jgi:hypothetical protein
MTITKKKNEMKKKFGEGSEKRPIFRQVAGTAGGISFSSAQ